MNYFALEDCEVSEDGETWTPAAGNVNGRFYRVKPEVLFSYLTATCEQPNEVVAQEPQIT